MELSALSSTHRHNAPTYSLPTIASARPSRCGVIRAPAFLSYLINREYSVSLPAGRSAIQQYQIRHANNIRQYLIRHADKLVKKPSHQVLDTHRDNINQLLQVDENTLVSVSSDAKMHCFTSSSTVGSGNSQRVWELSQVLGDPARETVIVGNRHRSNITDIACLLSNLIVSCSHDRRVIFWGRQGGLWNDIETINTGRPCSDIAVLSSTLFIVSASSGDVGIFQYGQEGYFYSRWYNGHSGFVYSLTVIDKTEFVSFGFDGGWRDWRLQRSGWSSIKYSCPVSINENNDNYPVIGVLLGKGILAIGYAQGDILIRWIHRLSSQYRGGLWRKMQALRHGEESESIKGIRSLTDVSFASYGDDAKIVLWQLKDWQWVAMQQLNRHEYPVSDCLDAGRGSFWTIDHSGVIECWQQLGDEWFHCRQIKARRDDYSDQFVRTSRLVLLNDKVTVISFSEDCVINLWLLNP